MQRVGPVTSEPADRVPTARARATRRLRRSISRLFWPHARAHSGARVVVLHEWVAVPGGSDKVAARLARVVDADVVFTFALDPACAEAVGIDRPVVTWRFGRWAARSRRFTWLLPLMPIVWWALDTPAAELTVTSSHACVNAARRNHSRRLSYCHTPMRYAWEWRLETERLPRPCRPLLPVVAAIMRRFDRTWSRNVDVYVANSGAVASRIESAYGRDAVVVHPPIEVDRFPLRPAPRHGGLPFVIAGRLVPYKRFDLAVEAANTAHVALIVAGDGPERARLSALAGPTVRVVDAPDDDGLVGLLAGAQAFLFPGVEDFGMVAVEAQACGTPVIARHAGGALDSVVAGLTGVFVESDDVADWSRALQEFDPQPFDPSAIRSWSESFGTDRFDAKIRHVLDEGLLP